MKDAIGQTILVGDKVFHSGTTSIDAGVYEVTGITKRMVQVLKPRHRKSNGYYRGKAKPKPANVLWRPERIVVVNLNLAALSMDKEPQVIHLWAEGYHVQGNQSKANYLGEYEALTKSDAFNRWADEQDQYTQETYVDRDRETYYGCWTYDNEIDARKSFG